MVDKVYGKLKHLPEDFVVEEIGEKWNCSVPQEFTANTPTDIGSLKSVEKKDFIWCELVKRDIDHFSAFKQVSRLLSCSIKDIGYAGTKDRFALTSQRLSLHHPNLEKLEQFSHDRLVLKNFKWAKRKIRLGYLQANHFKIAIRDVEKRDAMKISNEIRKTKSFPNFFGAQRFGSIRQNNVHIGKLILKRDFKQAVWDILTQDSPHERQDIRKARKRLVKDKDFKKALQYFPKHLRLEYQLLQHLSRKPEDFLGALRKGERKNILLFVNSVQSAIFNEIIKRSLDQGLNFTKKGHENGILPGYKTKFYDGPLGNIEREVLKEHHLELQDFDIKELPFLRIKGSYRKALVQVKDLAVDIQDDEHFKGSKKLLLEFTLPSGVYATTYLKNFFEFDNS